MTRDSPKPVRQFVKRVPHDLEHIVERCLRKAPAERLESAFELQRELEHFRLVAFGSTGELTLRTILRKSKRPTIAVPILLTLLLLGVLSAIWLHHSLKASWARTQALPQIAQLIDQDKRLEAYHLALRPRSISRTIPS